VHRCRDGFTRHLDNRVDCDALLDDSNRAFDLVCSSGSVTGARQGMHPVIGKKRSQTWTRLRGYPTRLEGMLEP